jgi:DNA-binding winged helix-turn-helix (wHTH) protein/class 3 adenylate cyclase/tetratricopeptide (TPR) repeat protein
MRYLFGDYALDTSRCELHRTGQRIPLRPKVFDVLRYLIAQRDRVVSQQELLEHLWPQQFVGEATLKSCIKEARRAVGDTGKAQCMIQTLHGRGYRFVAVVTEASESPPVGETRSLLTPLGVAAPEDLEPVVAHMPVLGAAAHVGAEGRDTCPDVLQGERKQVTILGCALADARGLAARLGAEAMYRLMQTFLALTQRVVQRHAGTLVQRLSDGFVAFFGAPVAQEDHARQAVLAAFELQQRVRAELALHASLRGASLATSIGLHTGAVIVGPLGEDAQTLYAALDDTTDVASRLQRLAGPDTILLSEATRRFVQEEVRVESYGILDSAELPRSLPVYRVREVLVRRSGVTGRGGRLLSPFVGRTRELTSLLALLAQVEAGHGQVVGIVGEPGIGKSRLLYEFARTLRDMGVGYVEGHCFVYDRATPYGPVHGILRQLCGVTDADGPEAMATKLRHGLRQAGMTPDEDAPYLLPLLGVPEDTTPLAESSPEVRRARTLAILRHLSLHSGQGQPCVIAIENVHWIDPTSEEYLTRLADSLSGAHLLLVTTYRPGYGPPWLDKSYATQLALPRLLPQDSRAVVQSVLASTPDAGRWEQVIVETAAGNPFFLEELAWAVRDGGAEQPASMIPDTVQAVLAARIDRLQPVEKRLLQTAAVIGHEVPLCLLQAIAELPEDVLQRGLARLQAGEFLYETRPFPDLVYTFKHVLTHQVAYGSLLQERRCTLHAHIADAIEGLYADRLAEQVERLAHHTWQGEMWEKAVVYLRQAGAKAIAGSANREAVAHFERILVALQHLPESRDTLEHAVDVRCDLRLALMPLNQRERSLTLLREAEAFAQVLDDPRRLGRVSIMIAHCLRGMGDLEPALATGYRVLDLATTRRDLSLQALAYFVLGEVYYSLGDYYQAINMLQRSVENLDHAVSQDRFGESTLGPGLQSVASRCWLIQALADVGAFAEGMILAEHTLQLAEADGHPYTLVLAYGRVGYLYLGQGQVHQAIPAFERGLELGYVWGIQQYRPWFAWGLGYALALSGRIPRALALLEQTVGQPRSISLTNRNFLNTVCWACEVYMLAGHIADAHNLTMQTLTFARKHKERGNEAWILRLLGHIATHRDPPEAEPAENYYQQALTLAEELGMRPLQAHCHLGLGTLYATMGQWQQARAELAAAIDLYRAMEMTFWLPQAEAALAQVKGR